MDILDHHLDSVEREGSATFEMAHSDDFHGMAGHDFEDRLEKHGVREPTTSSEHRARSSIIHGSSGTCSLGIKGDIHTAADNSQYRHGMLDGVGSKASSTENTPACTPLVIEPISKGAIARLFAGLAKSPAETIYKEPHNPPSLSHGPGQQHVQHLYDTAHGGQYGTSPALTAQRCPPIVGSFTSAWANVNQVLEGPYKDILTTYWQNTIKHLESDTPNYKVHQLPLARIKKVMKADPEVKMISAEAPILFAKGCDAFNTELTMRAWIHAEENKRRTLQRSDIASVLAKSDMFDFLIDITSHEESHPYVWNKLTKFCPKEGLNASDFSKKERYRYDDSDSVRLANSGQVWDKDRHFIRGPGRDLMSEFHFHGKGNENRPFFKSWTDSDDSLLSPRHYYNVQMRLNSSERIHMADNLNHEGWLDDHQSMEVKKLRGHNKIIISGTNSYGWRFEIGKFRVEMGSISSLFANLWRATALGL